MQRLAQVVAGPSALYMQFVFGSAANAMPHPYKHVRALMLICATAVTTLGASSTDTGRQAGEVVVIVSAANATKAMTKKEVADYFLRRRIFWPNGVDARPVDLPVNSPIRAEFEEKLLGRAAASVDVYWQRQKLTGGEPPPPIAQSETEVIQYVAEHPGALGYVLRAVDLSASSVKVIEIIVEHKNERR